MSSSGVASGDDLKNAAEPLPVKPSFERRWRGAPEDRVPRRGTISALSLKMQNNFSTRLDSSLSQEVMRLRRILSSASYGGTFFQKKAFSSAPKATPLIAERSDSDALQRYRYVRTSQSAQRSAPRSAALVNGVKSIFVCKFIFLLESYRHTLEKTF